MTKGIKGMIGAFIVVMAAASLVALLGGKPIGSMLGQVVNPLDTTSIGGATTTTQTLTTAIATTTTTTSSSTTTTTTTTTVAPTPTRQYVSISGVSNYQQLSGVQQIGIYATGVPGGVGIEIKDLNANPVAKIPATCVTGVGGQGVECSVALDTTVQSNGQYSITARVIYANGIEASSSAIAISIYNNLRPEFSFRALQQPLTETVIIKGGVLEATAVEYFYVPLTPNQTAANPIRMGSADFVTGTDNVSAWTYWWNTKEVSDGYYQIFAVVTNKYGTYKSAPITVNVYNPAPVAATTTVATPTTTTVSSTTTASTVPSTQQATTVAPVAQPVPEEQPITVPQTVLERFKQRVAQIIQPVSEIRQESKREPVQQVNQQPQITQVPPVVQPAENVEPILEGKYENPKIVGEVKPTLLQVTNVAVIATTTTITETKFATTTSSGKKQILTEKKEVKQQKLKLTGKAPAFATVTLYIFSKPVIVTVKADKNGNWEYTLDKTLEDGQHQAYVTINDKTGKIVAKSNPFGFIKQAEAITVTAAEAAQAKVSEVSPVQASAPVETTKRYFGFVVFLVIGLGFLTGIGLVMRSFVKNRNRI